MSRPQLLTFGASSFGLLDLPHRPAQVAVVVVVGGPQYRAGSHRHFVQLGRHLADAGYACLRFDHHGVGDCPGPLPDFRALDTDIDIAIKALRRAQPQLQAIVLWGLCDGASAALLYAQSGDPMLKGLALLNPWVRSAQGQARARVQHYYLDRLRSRDFWAKLLRGGVGLAALMEWLQTRKAARQNAVPTEVEAFQLRMARGYADFAGPILLQLSGRDHTAREFEAAGEVFPEWRGWADRPRLTVQRYPGADHTFSLRDEQKASFDGLIDWLRQSFDEAPQ